MLSSWRLTSTALKRYVMSRLSRLLTRSMNVQAGMWRDVGALFALKGEATYGDNDIKGPAAITAYLRKTFGAGQDGLATGALNVEFAADARNQPFQQMAIRRIGRWHVIAMRGKFGVNADWAGGVMDNDYVREGGVWKIAAIRN